VATEALSDVGALLAGLAAVLTAASARRTVRRHLTPNGGSSLRDAIDRIERDIGGLRSEIRGDRAAARATAVALAHHLGVDLTPVDEAPHSSSEVDLVTTQDLSAQSIVPDDVTEWLRTLGWTRDGRLGDIAQSWRRGESQVLVPTLGSSPDFALRWSEMLTRLSRALGTDAAGVLLAVAKAGSDIAEFPSRPPPARSGAPSRPVAAHTVGSSPPTHAPAATREAHQASTSPAQHDMTPPPRGQRKTSSNP